MDVQTLQKSSRDSAIDPVSLLTTPASHQTIHSLYKAGFITGHAKFLALRLIYKQLTLGHILNSLCYSLGSLLLLAGTILFFEEYWLLQNMLYQAFSIQLILLLAVWYISEANRDPRYHVLFISLAILLSLCSIGYFCWRQPVPLTTWQNVGVALFFSLPWLGLIPKHKLWLGIPIALIGLSMFERLYATL